MKILNITENIQFDNKHPHAEALSADENLRVFRFSLLPGQEIKEHKSPTSPVCINIIKGKGEFWGENGTKKQLEKGSLIIFNKNEIHGISALNEELVFIALLEGSPQHETKKID